MNIRPYKKKIIYRGDNKPYLVRYSIFSCKWFAIKIHHILLSDDDCLHDHPWAFISLLLKGSYVEVGTPDRKIKCYMAGDILYRRAEWAHKLMIEPGKTVWSFVITFKKQRQYGDFLRPGDGLNGLNTDQMGVSANET